VIRRDGISHVHLALLF